MSYRSNLNEVLSRLAAKEKGISQAVRAGAIEGAGRFITKIRQEQMSGRPGLEKHSGKFQQSWSANVKIHGDQVSVMVDSSHVASKIHQYGGIIRPVRAKALTIPVHPSAKGKAAGSFPDLFLLRTSKGAFLMRGGRGQRKPQLMYVLKKSVKIPKRLHVIEAYKRSGVPMIGRAMVRSVKQMMRGK